MLIIYELGIIEQLAKYAYKYEHFILPNYQ